MSPVDRDRLQREFVRRRGRGCIINNWPEFEEKVTAAYAVLIETAKNGVTITYSELGARIGIMNFPGYDDFPLKMAEIAGACSVYELEDNHPIISSIVVNKETGMPGAGYWGFRTMPSHLLSRMWEDRRRKPTVEIEAERAKFWLTELQKVHKHWSLPGRAPPDSAGTDLRQS